MVSLLAFQRSTPRIGPFIGRQDIHVRVKPSQAFLEVRVAKMGKKTDLISANVHTSSLVLNFLLIPKM